LALRGMQKYTSNAFSINVVVSDIGWRTEGTFRTITKTANSGNLMASSLLLLRKPSHTSNLTLRKCFSHVSSVSDYEYDNAEI
jgi:hypothetical protein